MSAELSIREAQSQIESILAKSPEDTNSPSPDKSSERTPEERHNTPDLNEEVVSEEQDEEAEFDEESEDGESEEESGEEAEESEEEASINTIEALAAEFDVDPETLLGSVAVEDGWGNEVSLGEALNGWREAKTSLLERQSQLDAQYQEKVAEINQRTESEIAKIAGLAQAMVKEMQADFEGVDLQELRLRDPVAYADMIERRQRRAEIIKQAVETMDFNAGLRKQHAGESVEKVYQREVALLRQAKPQWFKDGDTIKSIVQENTEYMRSLNYDDAAIARVTDHRDIITLNEAAQWRKSQKQAKGKSLENLRKQKGLRKPDLAKRATARVDPGDPRTRVRKDRAKNFSKTRSVKDAGKLLETFITKS